MDALSTTEQEMKDLLYITATKFQKKTGHWPYIMMDNNRIQRNIDISNLETNHQEGVYTHIPGDRLVFVPTHSPDCNRGVEHQFAWGKGHLHNQLYLTIKQKTTSKELQQTIRHVFTHLKPGAVVADVETLPWLWLAISTDEGVPFYDQQYGAGIGSGGDWTSARGR